MGDDWKVGDLAICVIEGQWFDRDEQRFDSIGPEVGKAYCVEYLAVKRGELYLGFPDWPEDEFGAKCFRKVRPDAAEGELNDWELILDSAQRRVDA